MEKDDCLGGQCQLWIPGTSTTSSVMQEGRCSVKQIALSLSEGVSIQRVLAQKPKETPR